MSTQPRIEVWKSRSWIATPMTRNRELTEFDSITAKDDLLTFGGTVISDWLKKEDDDEALFILHGNL